MKRKLALLVILIMIAQCIGVYAYAPKAQDHYKEAQILINTGKYEEAVKKLDTAIGIAPKAPLYLIAKGTALTGLQRGNDAILCYDRALEIINKYPTAEYKALLYELFINRGKTYISLSKPYEAMICYDKAITYNNAETRVYLEKAQVFDLAGKHGEALACLDKALELEPDNRDANKMKGKALQELNRYPEAIAIYDKLIEYEPVNAEILYNKSRCAALAGKPEIMLESLGKAISMDKKYVELARNESDFSGHRSNEKFIEIVGVVNIYGNTLGNIHSYGNVALQGDWIYYSYEQLGLWREKLDSSSKEKICDGYASDINVIGDWIYCNLFGLIENGDYNSSYLGFYKVKADGSEKIKLFDKRIEAVNIVGEWIYYCSESEAGKPYKMKTDGTGRKHLNVFPTRCISVDGDWIYYQNGADKSSLYRMDLNGENNQKISDVTSYRLDINISGDYVYVIGEYPTLGLYKVKKDGSGSEKMLEDQLSYLNVVGEWVYYTNYKDGIYRMKTDGTEKQKLYSGDVFGLCIAEDWIYFGKWSEVEEYKTERYYRMKTDGSGIQTIIKY